MEGVIGRWEVLSNLGLIWREFGARCALRCLVAILRGQRTTFLNVACKKHVGRTVPIPVRVD